MSNIQQCVNDIQSKRYGREVRQAFCDAILEVDSVSRTAKDSATANAATAAQKASEAKASELAAKASEEAAAQSEANAKTYAENAAAVAGAGIATQDTAGFMKGGDNYVDEAGTLTLTKTTTDRTLMHSHAGGLRIESVAGESVQESTTGAQLLDLRNSKSGTDNGITVTANADGSYHISGTAETAETNVWFKGSYGATTALFTLPAGTYTKVGVRMFNGTAPIGGIDDQTFTLTEDTPITGLRCKQLEAGKTYNETVYPMLNVGTALPWEPYTGGQPSPSPSYPQEIESSVVSEIKVSGKNLLKLAIDGTGKVNNTTYTVNEDKSVTVSATGGLTSNITVGSINVKAGETYIFSGCVEGGSNESYRVDIRYFGGGLVDSSKVDYGSGAEITAFRDDTWYYNIRINEGYTANNLVFKPMIREASAKDATFEPYQSKTITLSTPITLHGIGEVKDRIVKQDGVWGVERKIGEVVFDGSSDEGWTLGSTADTTKSRMYSALIKTNILAPSTNSTAAELYCSCFGVYTADGIYGKPMESCAVDAGGTFAIFSENYQTVSAWETYLAGSPMTVLYMLKTTTFDPLPEADQIALHSLVTYDTVTYLSTDSEIEPVVTSTYGTSKVGAEGIWNANRVVVLEKEKEDAYSSAVLLGTINSLSSDNTMAAFTLENDAFSNYDKLIINGTYGLGASELDVKAFALTGQTSATIRTFYHIVDDETQDINWYYVIYYVDITAGLFELETNIPNFPVNVGSIKVYGIK